MTSCWNGPHALSLAAESSMKKPVVPQRSGEKSNETACHCVAGKRHILTGVLNVLEPITAAVYTAVLCVMELTAPPRPVPQVYLFIYPSLLGDWGGGYVIMQYCTPSLEK